MRSNTLAGHTWGRLPGTTARLGAFLVLSAILLEAINTPVPDARAQAEGITVPVRGDAYVSETLPDSHHGWSKFLRTDGSPLMRAYIKFDVPQVTDEITKATLRVYSRSVHREGMRIFETPSKAWSESDVTFNTAPVPAGQPIAETGAFSGSSWVEFDVTGSITGSGMHSFIIESKNSTAISLASREAGPATAPQLVLETGPGQPSDPGAEVLLAAGDIAYCAVTTDEDVAAMLKELEGTIATLGDTVYQRGSPAQFEDCFDPAWHSLKSRIKPAIGNHEYLTEGAAGYWDYFGSAAGQRGKGYYSYNLGAWHIIVLNSQCSQGDGCLASGAQVQWLIDDLKANDAECTLAYWHHPRYSSGSQGNTYNVTPFWDVLYRYGADVVLNGHDHHYERFKPQNPAAWRDDGGIREFVVGTGGKSLRLFPNAPANSAFKQNTDFGALRLELRDDGYSWEFHAINGTVMDQGSSDCQGEPHPDWESQLQAPSSQGATISLATASLCVGQSPVLDEAVLPERISIKAAVKGTVQRTRLKASIAMKGLLRSSGCGECCCTQTCTAISDAYANLMETFPRAQERAMRVQ